MIDFIDSAYEPTLAQAQAAKSRGFTACGFYLKGGPNAYHTWSNNGVDILEQAGIIPLPIWLPEPSLSSDPVQEAEEALASTRQYGLAPSGTALYNGNHITVPGPVWTPIPGSKPSVLFSDQAVQYGTANIDGWVVDLDVASNDFSFSVIVVDFEWDTAKNPRWYIDFAAEITPMPLEDDMGLYVWAPATAGDPTFSSVDGTFLTLPDTYDVGQLQAQGYKRINYDHEMLAELSRKAAQ